MLRAVLTGAAILTLATATIAATPPPVAHSKTTFHLIYGTKDLGTWDTFAIGKAASGTYDGTSFDSSNGPGFATVTLTRPLSAADSQGLFASLPKPNVRLVVRTENRGKPAGQSTCPLAQVSEFGANPGAGTETITFACTTISSS